MLRNVKQMASSQLVMWYVVKWLSEGVTLKKKSSLPVIPIKLSVSEMNDNSSLRGKLTIKNNPSTEGETQMEVIM